MTSKDAKAIAGSAPCDDARDESRLPASSGPLEGCDALTLAAYLDGRLDAAATARLEAALAADPKRLELVLAAREALEAGSGVAPESLVARARALVPEAARRPAGWPSHWLPAPGRKLAFAAMTAAFVLVSLAGFELGLTGVAYQAEADRLLSADISVDGEDLL